MLDRLTVGENRDSNEVQVVSPVKVAVRSLRIRISVSLLAEERDENLEEKKTYDMIPRKDPYPTSQFTFPPILIETFDDPNDISLSELQLLWSLSSEIK